MTSPTQPGEGRAIRHEAVVFVLVSGHVPLHEVLQDVASFLGDVTLEERQPLNLSVNTCGTEVNCLSRVQADGASLEHGTDICS